jgi:hypothetical protein
VGGVRENTDSIRAEARTCYGENGVANRQQIDARSPRGPDETEESLAARIQARIEGRVGSRIYDLRVICSDNSVVVRGRARTYYMKQLAQESVLDLLNSALHLVNEITVG